jgi:hypothetical protein
MAIADTTIPGLPERIETADPLPVVEADSGPLAVEPILGVPAVEPSSCCIRPISNCRSGSCSALSCKRAKSCINPGGWLVKNPILLAHEDRQVLAIVTPHD